MNKEKVVKTSTFCFFSSLIVLFAGYQLYRATVWGAGLSPDSVRYLKGASILLGKESLSDLGSHWPPLFYFLIAASKIATGDLLVGVRWLQLTTFSLNLVVLGFILWRCTKQEVISSLVGPLLFANSTTLFFLHATVLSEPAFFLFSLLGLYFLARFVESKSSYAMLLLSALCIGLAFISRYIGVSLIVTGGISILLFAKESVRKRTTDCAIFVFIASLPMLLWMISIKLLNIPSGGREFAIHVVSQEKLLQGVNSFLELFSIPEGYPFILLILIAAAVAIYILSYQKIRSVPQNRIVEISFIFIVVYILSLLFSISFIDAHTPLDRRILSPVYIFFILGMLVLNNRLSKQNTLKYISYCTLAVFLLLIVVQYRAQSNYITYAANNGIDFAGKTWVQSDILKWIKQVKTSGIIYTNAPEAIDIYTTNSSKMIPAHINPITRKQNSNYKNELIAMVADVSGGKGMIVYFYSIPWRDSYLPSIAELNSIFSLKLLYQGRDGIVVQVRD